MQDMECHYTCPLRPHQHPHQHLPRAQGKPFCIPNGTRRPEGTPINGYGPRVCPSMAPRVISCKEV